MVKNSIKSKKNTKDNNNKNIKRRHNKKEIHSHWKFKNAHKSNKISRIEKKQKLLIEQAKKNLNKENEDNDIRMVENENNLLADNDNYTGDEDIDTGILNWEEEQNDNIEKPNQESSSLFPTPISPSSTQIPIDPKLKSSFSLLGEVLKDFHGGGSLPKLFYLLAKAENWKALLELTKPERWSNEAIKAATVVFSSGDPETAKEFYEIVLVDRVKKEIKIHSKLSSSLYDSLWRSLFKPSAFFKGLIAPLSRRLTPKEAAIVGSVLRRSSVPCVHASAALVMLTDEIKKGKNGVSFGALYFMKVLLQKKYAIPMEVKDIIVNFLLSYENYVDTHKMALPVLWHQVFLCFVQHYKFDINDDQKKKLKELNGKVGHKDIKDEIYKELNFVGNNN